MRRHLKRFSLIVLVMVFVVSATIPVSARKTPGYDGIHFYLILDPRSIGYLGPEGTEYYDTEKWPEIKGKFRLFMDWVKYDNPKNKVTVILKNDVEGTFNFLGNYARFNEQFHVRLKTGVPNIGHSIQIYEKVQGKEEGNLKPVILFVDSDGGLYSGYYQFSTNPDPYARMDEGMAMAVDRFKSMLYSIPGDPAVYTIRFQFIPDASDRNPFERHLIERTRLYSDTLFRELTNRRYTVIENWEELSQVLELYKPEFKKEIEPTALTMEQSDFWWFYNFTMQGSVFQNAYIKAQLDRMDPVDRKLIETSKQKKNEGNCYGMALSSALAYDGRLEKEKIPLKDSRGNVLSGADPIAEATKESAQEIVNFYHNTFSWKRSKIPLTAYHMDDNRQAIDKLVRCMKPDASGKISPVVLTYEIPERKIGHSVVAYDMYYRPNQDYDYVVDIYENNDPENKYENKLWINSKTHEFKMDSVFPFDQESGRIYEVNEDLFRIDPLRTQKSNYHQTIMTFGALRNGSLETIDGKRRWKIDADRINNSEIDIVQRPANFGEDSEYVAIMPEGEKAYRFRPSKGESEDLDATIVYDDQLISVSADRASEVVFYPEGTVDVKDAGGDLEISLVQNDAEAEEALEYTVKAKGRGDVSLSQDARGLSSEGDLAEVKVRAEGEKGESKNYSVPSISGKHTFADGKDLPKGQFRDVKASDWYYSAVDYVFKHRMMTGVASDRFDPNGRITRAQMAQIVYNLGEKTPRAGASSRSKFSDVASDAWYKEAVDWAEEKGLVMGYGDKTFGPDDPLTREQAMSILYRYVQKTGKVNSTDAKITGFQDISAISDYAREPMAWATSSGIIKGDERGYLNPKATTRRSEMAQILMNMGDLIGGRTRR